MTSHLTTSHPYITITMLFVLIAVSDWIADAIARMV